MIGIASKDDADIRRLAEASAWQVMLVEDDLTTSPEFEAWLGSDPKNEAAWDQVRNSWTLVGDQASAPELLALRRDALARAHRQGGRRWTVSKSWMARIAACLILFLGVGLAYSSWPARGPLVYATALGERRFVTLDDGSRISLDSSTEVRVSYTGDARRLDLINGQARFDVAHDVNRPFIVHARDQVVVATGTAFTVDLLGSRVMVTLIEGRVSVLREDPDSGPRKIDSAPLPNDTGVPLSAGQQLTATIAAPPRIDTISLDRATAWENGVLIFEDEPLASIAERISRYSTHPIRVDPAAANLRISGVFHSGDVSTFIDTVHRYLSIRAVSQPDGSVVLTSRG